MGVVTSLSPVLVGFRILEYARYAVRLETREADGIKQTPKSMPTLELLPLNLPAIGPSCYGVSVCRFSAAVLALLAIPLSFVNPRAGRSANMLLAILVYVIYNNLLTISQGWVANDQVSFAVGVLAVHLMMLFLLPLLFYHRIAVSSFPSRAMKIYRRYLMREVSGAIFLVLLAFLALFAFFDLLGEVKDIGRAATNSAMPLLSFCCGARACL
jgi:hypothetical protein